MGVGLKSGDVARGRISGRGSDDVLYKIQVVIAKLCRGHRVCRLEATFIQIIVVGVVSGDGLLLLLLPLIVS